MNDAGLLCQAHAAAAEGRDETAIALYRRILAVDPGAADAANNLGVLLRRQGRDGEATGFYRQALAAAPGHADACWNLGRALLDAGAPETVPEAYLLLRRAVTLRPCWERWHGLGQACQAMGALAEAEAAYRQALALSAAPESLNNLSNTLQAAGRPAEALALLERALELSPEQADIRFNRALLLLLLGRAREGWREHEWRWRAPGFASPRRSFRSLPWDGRPTPGATLLLHWEQGLGDTIQFSRFVAAARARVGKVILEVQQPLMSLLQDVAGVDLVVGPGGDPDAPRHDLHAPLLSLPFLLGMDGPGNLPEPPYLAAPGPSVDVWRVRMAALEGLRVGLVWAGNPRHLNDRQRSASLLELEPLSRVPGVSWVSLQLGAQADQLRSWRPMAGKVLDCSPWLTSFSDTAAAIMNLDLVIAVDTAVAHLAGALGRPSWVLLPHAPDWRWGLEAPTTGWYPATKLWRQPAPGAWRAVAEAAAAALQSRVGRNLR